MLVRLGLRVCLTGLALLTLAVAAGGAACSKNFDEPDSSEEVPPSQARAASQRQPGAGAGRVEYQAPTGWVEQTPSSRMRQAQYLLPRAQGDRADAELVVFHFPGQGGSIQANMARWIGQMSRPDGSSATADVEISEKMVRGQKVTLLEVSGTYQSGEWAHEPGSQQTGLPHAGCHHRNDPGSLVFQIDRPGPDRGEMVRLMDRVLGQPADRRVSSTFHVPRFTLEGWSLNVGGALGRRPGIVTVRTWRSRP